MQVDENVVSLERIKRELPEAKMPLTLPIWVVGVDLRTMADQDGIQRGLQTVGG